MKSFYALAAIVAFASTTNAAVLTVNNNNPSPGQFMTLAAAQTAASAGDTLYISGSPYNYNSFTFSKRLTLIGTGHKPQNTNPSVSKLDDIDFYNDTSLVNHCRIIGLDVNTITANANYQAFLEVRRCKFRNYFNISAHLQNLTLEGNFFESSGLDLARYYPYNIHDILIQNNVFNGYVRDFNANANPNIYFQNNLFLYQGDVFTNYYTGSTQYLTIINNIFYRSNPGNGLSNSLLENNITYGGTTALPTSGNVLNNNLPNANPLFINFPAAGDYYGYNYDFNLQSTSPALNAGNDGKDIGLTGGNGYFQKYGIPSIPQIRSFQITSPANGIVSPGGTLQVNIISTIKR